jgi:hypothetical protein
LNLCDIEEVSSVFVSKEDEISQKVDIRLKDPEKEVSYDNVMIMEKARSPTRGPKKAMAYIILQNKMRFVRVAYCCYWWGVGHSSAML